MGLRTGVSAGAMLIALGALASDAAAGAPADRLHQFFAATNTIITDEATASRPQAKIEAIRRLVRELFAFREAAEHVLGPTWGARTPAERAEFVSLFSDVAESSFLSALASRARLDGGAHVTVLGESEKGDEATVKTVVAARSGSEIQVDYHMRRLGERWAVGDVALDGVSLLDNYRAQMRRMIDRWSFEGLLAEMRARVRGGGGASATEAAALPGTPASPSRTAAAAGITAVDVGAGPASSPASATRAATVTSPGGRDAVVSPEPLIPAAPRVTSPAAPAGSPLEPPRALSAAPPAAVTPAAPAAVPPAASTASSARTPAGPATGPSKEPAATRAPAEPATRPSTEMTTRTPGEPATRASAAAAPVAVPRPSSMSAASQKPDAVAAPSRIAATSPPAPKPVAARPRTVTAKPSPPSFWVQVGAFRTLEAATEMTARLHDQPIAIDMTEGREPLLRVRVGPFPDHAGAAAALSGLKAKGLQGFVVQ